MRIRYWLKTGVETLLTVLAACLFYTLIMVLQGAGGLQLDMLLQVYLLVFGAILLPTMTIGLYKFNVNLALSFGSTRNEVLLGLQCFRAVPILGVALIQAILSLVLENPILPAGTMLAVSLGVFLIAGGVGSLMGVAFLKWGKLGSILTVITILVFSFAFGFVAGFGADAGWFDWITSAQGLLWVVLGLGLLVYSLCMIPEQRVVWKYVVKM